MPYNGNPKIIDIVIAEYSSYVVCFYGSLGIDKFGGGRAPKSNQLFSLHELKKIVKKLESKNIEFNYVINNTNLLNREFNPEYLLSYKNFLSQLISIGITTVTLCNSFLIQFTKENYPYLKVSASVNLKIRSLNEVTYALKLGCDEIALHYDILKNFSVLRDIKNNCNIPLKLIPNDIYIMDCPWQKGHTRMQGANSRTKEINTPYFSYYRNKCINIRNYRPDEILKAMWIAPEQLYQYVKLGYNHFKLLDRLASTDWNIRVLRAYIDAKPYPHMERVLGTYGRIHTEENLKSLDLDDPPYPLEKLEYIPQIHPADKDNQKIINYWLSEKHPSECGKCQHCNTLSKHTLLYPEEARKIAKERNKEWQEKITKLEFIKKLNNCYIQRVKYE